MITETQVKDKKNVPLYVHRFGYRDNFDKVYMAMRLYAEMVNIKAGHVYIRHRMVEVMSFYLLYGYSPETKKKILATTGFTVENLNQINSELTKKGYLLADQRNFRKKHLCPVMQQMRDFFLECENNNMRSIFAFAFEKEK